MNTDSFVTLLYPMAFYVFYIGLSFIGVFLFRLKGARAREYSPKYYKNYADKSLVPNKYIIIERHVDNQFQMPMLFLITCTVLIALDRANSTQVLLAWLFIISRMIHSYVHLTYNHVIHRAIVYGVGLLIVMSQWAVILAI